MGRVYSNLSVPLTGFLALEAGTGALLVLNPRSRNDRGTGLTVWTLQDGETEYVRTGHGEVVALQLVLDQAAAGYRSAYEVANTWPGGSFGA